LTCVPWWNKELSKLRVEVRKLFNQARKTHQVEDWKHFHKAQHAYKEATIVAKTNS
jgi:hypothetical protein